MTSSWYDRPPQAPPRPRSMPPAEGVAIGRSMATRLNIAASSERVWADLERQRDLVARRPLYLRLLLPRPKTGEPWVSLYVAGALVRRVQRVGVTLRYDFTLCAQEPSARGPQPPSGVELTMTTRYGGVRRPRWLRGPVENLICRLWRRHVLHSIKRRAERSVSLGR